jgi:hypothetical protein
MWELGVPRGRSFHAPSKSCRCGRFVRGDPFAPGWLEQAGARIGLQASLGPPKRPRKASPRPFPFPRIKTPDPLAAPQMFAQNAPRALWLEASGLLDGA